MIKVLLVDDHDLVRFGVRRLLEDHGAAAGVAVAGEAASGEEAVAFVREHHPDVVLLDLNMPGIGGVTALRRILQIAPQTRVIVLTALANGPLPRAVLEGGAAGYLTKGCKIEEMIEAIQTVARNGRYISREIAQGIALTLIDGAGESPLDLLSQREIHVLTLIAQGYRAADIAVRLAISPKTVSTYKTRILGKLRMDSTAELVRFAVRLGLVGEAGDPP